ncbi:cytochrome P450 [Infundibulicybe gibba]|nr:cytochrome P450 [Infundibulicybe gibba]
MDLFPLSAPKLNLALASAGGLVGCASALVHGIKRMYFHPLAKYPGPALAAVSGWYRAYYDIIMDGGWTQHLERLHEAYGPVVRVGPNELHFSDPRVHGDIYGMTSRFAKQPALYSCFATDLSVFALFDMHEATQRRNTIGPFFARRAVSEREEMVQAKVDALIAHLGSFKCKNTSANLDLAFRSTSLDVVTTYCFGESPSRVDADPEYKLLHAMDATLPMLWVFKHLPILKHILLSVPEVFAGVLKPSTRGILIQRAQMGAQVDEILRDPCAGDGTQGTVYHHLLAEKAGGGEIPAPAVTAREWLLDEGLYMRFAGGDTVGNVCTVGAFYVMRDPAVCAALVKELDEAWPEADAAIGYEKLEKLPYLTAVVKESLRMAHGVVTPLPRVVGPGDASIGGMRVPAGTVISMGATIVHRNSEIFPNPTNFTPERWLEDPGLDKYLVAFSRGPRSCLGINLAWCELYLIFGTLFRRLHLEADNATLNDISYREYFVPVHRGKHLHVWVHDRK